MTNYELIAADRQRVQAECLAQASRDRLIAQLPRSKRPAPGIAALHVRLVSLIVSRF